MIRFDNYSKKLKGRYVLNEINCLFEQGKIYKLYGTNGSGKTMLLRAIAGLIYPTSGRLLIKNVEVTPDSEIPVTIGALIENPNFWRDYTGMEILKYLASINDRITDDEIKNCMSRMMLDPDDKRKVGKYSLGMRQKLGIVQAYMEKPDVLLLDEPLNALDKEGIHALEKVLNEEKERGAVIVLALHNDGDFEIDYDSVLRIQEGRLCEA